MPFFLIVALILFVVFGIPAGISLSYFISGYVLLRQGKRENSYHKIKSGKITMINASAFLVLLLVIAFFIFYQFLRWEL